MKKQLIGFAKISIIMVFIFIFPPQAFSQPYEHPPQTSETFSDNFDQYTQAIGLKSDLTTVGGIITALLPWIIIIGGLILLFMLIMGGFNLLTAADNPDKAAQGQKVITSALIGFFVLFAAYWIAEILTVVFGINILDL